MKNNASAKRSRDARRMMENQAYAKAALLERENAQLRLELERLTLENKTLRDLLSGPLSNRTTGDPASAKPTVCDLCGGKSPAISSPIVVPSSTPIPSPTSLPKSLPLLFPDTVPHTSCTQYRFIQPRCLKT
ncbi:Hepatic leukemia factor [Fasciolopsis buskii]|uniref:Hepatic leukemia factor n=1 Tax=Fasciolopsis buskii TaxID=27845 RepID=A0A8E0RM92_9TREM|nr:Hepatic leukemia factor [Fasciolopsis buski]